MLQKIIYISALLILSSCGGGDSSLTSNDATYDVSGITGVVQKGPLIYGSYVNAYLLDKKLNPTGQIYVTQTKDDLGNFKISSNISSNLVRLVATGYYFDEVSGALSTSPTTLSAIVDLTVSQTPTINVLTTLQAPRVEVLIGNKKTYTEALQQSAIEVLSIFGIDTNKIAGYKSLYGMQINGNQDADSVLLAASSILAKMSSTAAMNSGSSQAAELSYYISRIASDIANYGELKNTTIKTAINSAKSALSLEGIRSNVESYYLSRGTTLTAPKFEEWIDKNLSGKIPRRTISATSGSFQSITPSSKPNSSVVSNEVVIASDSTDDIFAKGLFLSTCTSNCEPASEAKVKLNGEVISTGYFSVKSGDKIQIQATSPSWGQTNGYKLTLGSQILTFSISTSAVVASFYQGYTWNGQLGTFGCWNQGGPTNFKQVAVPFYTNQIDFSSNTSVTSRYIAVGVLQSGGGNGPKTPSSLVIKTDNAGSPSGTVVATGTIGNYISEGTVSDAGGTSYTTNRIPVQGFFGEAGVALQANTKYWLVLTYSETTTVDFDRCGAPEPASYGEVKISADGSSWSSGNVGYFPKIFMFR
jgi:hypothetical protein